MNVINQQMVNKSIQAIPTLESQRPAFVLKLLSLVDNHLYSAESGLSVAVATKPSLKQQTIISRPPH